MGILVFGSTSKVGRSLVSTLVQTGADFVAVTRDPASARLPQGAVVRKGDLEDRESLLPLVEGVESVFAVGTGAGLARQMANLASVLSPQSVRRVVFLSSLTIEGQETNPIGEWHGAAEERLSAAGVPHTFLRAGVFMSNAANWGPSIREGRIVRSAARNAFSAPIHPADLADVAHACLTSDGHAGRAYALTGPESLSVEDQLDIIGDRLGIDIKLEELPDSEAVELFTRRGSSLAEAEAALRTLRSSSEPWCYPGNTTSTITGRPGRRFTNWVDENLGLFQ
ncbi:NAD(P)H-binding protein [Streptomyces sp. 769]|uniref:SDR family oxidoreductase n=1 Tax=Streptomyces sp. 769 TaxID=1262452 RepID=UPI000581C467|nr:NAD(P)H-binding protein [Streptomyces sp. 769]AJC62153.1 putative hydroxylase [Streptomyces sp. 769]